MSKVKVALEGSLIDGYKLVAKVDSNEDGTPAIEIKINLGETVDEVGLSELISKFGIFGKKEA